MTREFQYRPQYYLLLLGLGGLIAAFKFLPAIRYGEIGFAFLVGLFGLTSLTLAVVFLVLFTRHLGSGNLIITDNQIQIPGHWTKRTILNFDQIKIIGTIDSWDKVIKVSDGYQTHSIQGQLLDKIDLEELKTILKDKLK